MSVAPQQNFFERIGDDSEGPMQLRAGSDSITRPSSMDKNEPVYQGRPEPVNSGERYMREHFNGGVQVPEVIDKSCCGTLKRHKFRLILIGFICAIVTFIVAGTILYVLL